jgi:hypothetical protein
MVRNSVRYFNSLHGSWRSALRNADYLCPYVLGQAIQEFGVSSCMYVCMFLSWFEWKMY